MRIAVIGAGILGTSVAFRLQKYRGFEVILVDRGWPGTGTTSANYAWVNANEKLPKEYFNLNHAGLEEYMRLQRELPGAPLFHQGGNLSWTTNEDGSRELEERVERLHSWGYEAHWRKGSEVNSDLEPQIAFPSKDTPVAYFPREGWVDAPLLTSRLAQLAEGEGAELRFGESLEAVRIVAGAVKSIRLSGGETLSVAALVNAGGPWADEISSLAGVPLPLSPTRGLLVSLELEEQPIRRLIHTDYVNLRPATRGRVVLHHDSVDKMLWEHPEDVQGLASALLERAISIVPVLERAKISEVQVSVRPIPEDGLSCVGEVKELSGYYEAVTHSGVTLGPLLGRLLAEEIASGEPSSLLSFFQAERFSRTL